MGMDIDIKIRIEGKAWRRYSKGPGVRPHPQFGNESGQTLKSIPQSRPVGCAIQNRERDNGRPKIRITTSRAPGGRIPTPQLRTNGRVHGLTHLVHDFVAHIEVGVNVLHVVAFLQYLDQSKNFPGTVLIERHRDTREEGGLRRVIVDIR